MSRNSEGSSYGESMVRMWWRIQRRRVSFSDSVGDTELSEETKDKERERERRIGRSAGL